MKKSLIKIAVISCLLSSLTFICSYAATWHRDNNGWWYEENNGSYPRNTWKKIGEYWYYFYSNGYMAENTTTPDNFYVDRNGRYIDTNTMYQGAQKIYTRGANEIEIGQFSDDGRVYISCTKNGQDIWYGTESEILAYGSGIEIKFANTTQSNDYISVRWNSLRQIDGIELINERGGDLSGFYPYNHDIRYGN